MSALCFGGCGEEPFRCRCDGRVSVHGDVLLDMRHLLKERDELLADMRELLKITDTRIPLGEKYAETAIRLEGCIDRLREKWGEK